MSGCWRNPVAVNHKGFNHSIICIWFFFSPIARCMPTYCLTFAMSESSVFVPLYDFPLLLLWCYFADLNCETVSQMQACGVSATLSDAAGLLAEAFSVKYRVGAQYEEQKGLGWNMKYWKSACFTNRTVAWTSLASQPQNVKTEQLIPSWTADWMLATRHNVV